MMQTGSERESGNHHCGSFELNLFFPGERRKVWRGEELADDGEWRAENSKYYQVQETLQTEQLNALFVIILYTALYDFKY